MTEVRVETKAFYSKPSLNKDHIAESSQAWAQTTIDDYLGGGWRLVSTDAAGFGAALYVVLYFEREV